MKFCKEIDQLVKSGSLLTMGVYTSICLCATGRRGFFENMCVRTVNNLQILTYPDITKIPANIFDIHIAVKCHPSSSIKAKIDKQELRKIQIIKNQKLLN